MNEPSVDKCKVCITNFFTYFEGGIKSLIKTLVDKTDIDKDDLVSSLRTDNETSLLPIVSIAGNRPAIEVGGILVSLSDTEDWWEIDLTKSLQSKASSVVEFLLCIQKDSEYPYYHHLKDESGPDPDVGVLDFKKYKYGAFELDVSSVLNEDELSDEDRDFLIRCFLNLSSSNCMFEVAPG